MHAIVTQGLHTFYSLFDVKKNHFFKRLFSYNSGIMYDQYTANVYVKLQSDQSGFLQYLQGKPVTSTEISLQSANITGIFPADITNTSSNHPLILHKHLQCIEKWVMVALVWCMYGLKKVEKAERGMTFSNFSCILLNPNNFFQIELF